MEIIVVTIKNCTFHPDVLVQNGLYSYEVFDGNHTWNVLSTAPNVKIGMITLFAPVGAMTPKGVVIKNVSFKGLKSDGILCTTKDLDISPSEEGVIDLPKSISLGTAFKQIPSTYLSSTPWHNFKLVDSIWENKLTKKLVIIKASEELQNPEDFILFSQSYFHNGTYIYRSF